MQSTKKYYSEADALKVARKFCAYQERSHSEVRTRLLNLGQRGHAVENIIANLIDENFLNEERFANAFATGKFRMKKWGRVKIENELKLRQVSSYCIKNALQQIEEKEYDKTLESVLKKKWKTTAGIQVYQRKIKTAQYLISRGYESDLVWKKLNRENED